MKAIVYTNNGSADGLKLEEIEKPTAEDDEVLIKVPAQSTAIRAAYSAMFRTSKIVLTSSEHASPGSAKAL